MVKLMDGQRHELCKQKNRNFDEQACGWTDMDGQTYRWTDIWMDRHVEMTDIWMDRHIDGQTYGWTDISMDRHMDGQTHEWTDT